MRDARPWIGALAVAGRPETDAYYDLGPYSRSLATDEPAAQVWFDRGLNWIYGFNHEEAARCFERAIEADRECALPHWGLAYAHGPFINKQWSYYSPDDLAKSLAIAHRESQAAVSLIAGANGADAALCRALTARYQSRQPPGAAGFELWNDEYAAAMREAHGEFPQDLDVMALFVEAMMMRSPWQLWDLTTGEPMPGADTIEMMAVLKAGQRLMASSNGSQHPGLMHMHIHTVEMSASPEQALATADELRGFAPDNAHLLHMPGHIYALCGQNAEALAVSLQAVAADTKHMESIGPFTHYMSAFCHDLHLLMQTAMLVGKSKLARHAKTSIETWLTDEVLEAAAGQLRPTLEAYRSLGMHVLVRFGRWQEILAAPLPANSELYIITSAMARYGRCIAEATLGHAERALQERSEFGLLYEAIPSGHSFLNNDSQRVLDVAAAMMDGEMAFHRGEYETAFAHLRHAVELNDALNYTEPWAWLHPPRHALGALLLAQARFEEAEQVYRADLGIDRTANRATQHPNNIWGLHGLAECLRSTGKLDELAIIEPGLVTALARSDVPIESSCMCRPSSTCCK